MEKITVSILGYGWLGTPLAHALSKAGMTIKASTTTPAKLDSIKSAGLQPYLLSLSPELELDDMSFFDADVLVVNFPPRRRPDIVEYHTRQVESLFQAVRNSPIKNVLYVSSTSVYPPVNREVTEADDLEPEKPSGKALRIAEAISCTLRLPNRVRDKPCLSTILRFSGLVGDDRVPGRFLAGKTNIKDGDAPVNLIHQHDCVQIMKQIIEQSIWGEIFNASMDEHPTRREFYTVAADKAGLPRPQFDNTPTGAFKIINSQKLKDRLGYQFLYSNPMDIL